ncbi:MAG: hypothetical protein Q7U47_01100 [Paludibacter sp.]|nr:hypothetical protein [Paludibacter sp.]
MNIIVKLIENSRYIHSLSVPLWTLVLLSPGAVVVLGLVIFASISPGV